MYAAPLNAPLTGSVARINVSLTTALLVARGNWRGAGTAWRKALRAIDELCPCTLGHPRRMATHTMEIWGPQTQCARLHGLFHALHSELGEERVDRMLLKLRYKGTISLTSASPKRYWGGSLLQDHGCVSMFDFGTATLYLLNFVPRGAEVACFYSAALRRALEAMPQDEYSQSSYCSLYLYLNEVAHFRDALKSLQRRGHLRTIPFHLIVDIRRNSLKGRRGRCHRDCYIGDTFIGGNGFFNQIAQSFMMEDSFPSKKACWSLSRSNFNCVAGKCIFPRPLWGLFTHDHCCEPASTLSRPARLRFFEDREWST